MSKKADNKLLTLIMLFFLVVTAYFIFKALFKQF